MWAGKTVCVTGAGGSIGSELCAQLAAIGVSKLIMVGRSEGPLHTILLRLLAARRRPLALKLVLGSVTDERRMADTLKGVDLVIHAAAHKHVPICEEHPLEAIENNVGGTFVLANAAEQVGVKRFVLVSSDKAVFPQSVMGATKRVAELIVRDLFVGRTRFATVRFGNVLNSSGSVLPIWREQIKRGEPITLTDPACERYFMSIPEAVELTIAAAGFDDDAQRPYVLDMGARKKMGDLANEVLRKAKCKLPITVTGLRPGEKLVESLHHGGALLPTSHPRIRQVAEDGTRKLTAAELLRLLGFTRDRDEKQALKRLWEIVS